MKHEQRDILEGVIDSNNSKHVHHGGDLRFSHRACPSVHPGPYKRSSGEGGVVNVEHVIDVCDAMQAVASDGIV